MNRSTPPDAETPPRTVRSFCRICTAVCGIIVDVEGDEVVRHQGNVYVLTDKDDIDTVTGMVRYSGIPVTVEPAPQ